MTDCQMTPFQQWDAWLSAHGCILPDDGFGNLVTHNLVETFEATYLFVTGELP